MSSETTKSAQNQEWVQLIARTAEGDQAALATLYDRTSPQVFGLVLKILTNREAAEEVTLDVYTQVWRQAHTYDQTRGAPGAWLMMLARTRAIDRFRAGAAEHARTESLDAAHLFASDDETPEQDMEGQERRRYVRQALAMLAEEQRQAIALAYFYGLSQSEIAEKLQLPLGTVKTRIRLGMMKLREALAPYETGVSPVTEIKLPEELEEQAMLYALGILDQDDRRAFAVRLQGESQLLRQAATAYQTTTDALAAAVSPVAPRATLRERLVSHIALEAAREAEQFELAADTLALGSVPVMPRDALRERLLSRIEGESSVRLDLGDSANVRGETSVPVGEGIAGEREKRLPQDDSPANRLRSCWTTVLNFLRTLVIRSVTSERVRYWKAKIAFHQPTKGLTYIRASEGIWRGIAPGVTAKVLSFDPVSRRITTLLRFAPGTSYAPHRHTEVEELFVLEGGCSIAGRAMAVGDYHRAESGTVHHDTSTDEGCLLFVISSPQNEMLR